MASWVQAVDTADGTASPSPLELDEGTNVSSRSTSNGSSGSTHLTGNEVMPVALTSRPPGPDDPLTFSELQAQAQLVQVELERQASAA